MSARVREHGELPSPTFVPVGREAGGHVCFVGGWRPKEKIAGKPESWREGTGTTTSWSEIKIKIRSETEENGEEDWRLLLPNLKVICVTEHTAS
jgi:hypothetical protein